MVQKGAIWRQKLYSNFQGFAVPKFWLFLLLLKVEIVEQLNLIFQLNHKPDLRTQAEVAYNKERDYLKESQPVYLLLVAPPRHEFLVGQSSYLHDVPNVEVADPLRLIKKAKDVSPVSFFTAVLHIKLLYLWDEFVKLSKNRL